MRNLDTTFAAATVAPVLSPAILVLLTFATATRYVWSGVGQLVFNGNTYLGVGSLGSIGGISEGVGVKADGTTVTLSGIDPIWLAESMTDIQLGGLAEIFFGAVAIGSGNVLIGNPYRVYRGCVDQPTVVVGADTVSITLALENRLLDLQRAQSQRYTAADQNLKYPTDMAFNWVEILNDIALREGS